MIKRTKWVFDAIDGYMKVRGEAKEEYVSAMRRIESARGSDYYKEEMKKAAEKRSNTVSQAAAAARADLDDALQSMRNFVREKAMPAPTPEMLSILQLLKLKEHVSEAELSAAARSMNGHSTALSLLDEMARANGIFSNYVSLAKGGLTGEPALKQINSLAEACYKILNQKHNANSIRAYAEEIHAKRYGGNVDYDSLPDERRFEDPADFINRCTSVGYDAFSRTVDPED